MLGSLPVLDDRDMRRTRIANRILTKRFRARPDLDEFHLHDPLAVAAVIEPDVLTYRQATVSVVTEGQERGRTVATYSDGPMKVAVGVDEGRAVGLVRNLIEGRA